MENVEAKLKTYNLSEAIELMNQGFLVREINWESRFISNFDKDGIEKRYEVFDYLKMVKTNLRASNINNQPYIAKFYYNAGWMPNPYTPTSYEMIAGEFVVIDVKDVKKEIPLIGNVDKENINQEKSKYEDVIKDVAKEKVQDDSLFFMASWMAITEVLPDDKNLIFTTSNDNVEITIKFSNDCEQLRIKNSKNKQNVYIEVPKNVLGDWEIDLFSMLSLWFLNELTTEAEDNVESLREKLLKSDLKALKFMEQHSDMYFSDIKSFDMRWVRLIEKLTKSMRLSDTNVERLGQIQRFYGDRIK